MVELTNCTFAIPVRIDSKDRLENIRICVEYLTTNFNTNIIIIENDKVSNLEKEKFIKYSGVKYIFQQDENNNFHRTKILNDILAITTTKVWFNYDCDAILPIQSYKETVDKILEGKVCVIPYKKSVYRIDKDIEMKFLRTLNLSDITTKKIKYQKCFGLAIALDTNFYKSIGGENESAIDWGFDDLIRKEVIEKLGYEVVRLNYDSYHLEHKITVHSGGNNPNFNNNRKEFNKISEMNLEELKKTLNTGRFISL